MPVHVALFRALNVGGRNRLTMKDLVALLEGLGASDVRTYVQSGNAVFRHRAHDAGRLGARIGAAAAQAHGFEPQVLVLGVEALREAAANNPFPDAEEDPSRLHLGFLAEAPASPDLAGLEALRAERERFRLLGRVFYLHAPDGVGRSKLAAASEKRLGVAMTDRNWRTVQALLALADAVSSP